jgi:hypothetical protein
MCGMSRRRQTLSKCVRVCLLLQDLRGEGGILEDMCDERRRAEACVREMMLFIGT